LCEKKKGLYLRREKVNKKRINMKTEYPVSTLESEYFFNSIEKDRNIFEEHFDECIAHQKKYFDMAEKEDICINRGI